MSFNWVLSVSIAFLAGFGLKQIIGYILELKNKGGMDLGERPDKVANTFKTVEMELLELVEEEHKTTRNFIRTSSSTKGLELDLKDLGQSIHNRLAGLESKLAGGGKTKDIPKPLLNKEPQPRSLKAEKTRETREGNKASKENKDDVLYTKAPNKEGKFLTRDLTETYDRGHSVYELKLKSGGMSATLTIIKEEEVIQKMMSFPDDYLKPACNYEGVAPHLAKKVRILKPGKAVRDQNEWRIVDKISIELV